MAVVSPFQLVHTFGLYEAEAASNCLVGRHKRLDICLSESAGSSVSTAAGETHSEGTPTSQNESLLLGSAILPSGGPPGLLSLAFDEPAYICLDGYNSTDSSSIDHGSSDIPMTVRSECSVSGHVWLLCQDPDGSRRVQDALDESSPHETREALLQELHGHACKAMRDPHANHVLQKSISIMTPSSLQFMIDELLESDGLATAIARHRYGCRIVQQLLKRCSASQVSGLAEALMQEVVSLACHNFGNFSVQHLLQFGTEEQRDQLAQAIVSNAETLSSSKAGDGVILAAMEHASSKDKLLLAQAVLHEPGLLVRLAQGRFGHSAVMHMLQVLDGQESLQAYMVLKGEMATLRASTRFSRVVVKYLEETTLNLDGVSREGNAMTHQASPLRVFEL
mmetsp:Transcript_80148/g.202734  ORF Transcript_80148/g.202734 Transcript_80148/m.202734 type:complete len:394 (+) Transcript_80148:74-1255(+)